MAAAAHLHTDALADESAPRLRLEHVLADALGSDDARDGDQRHGDEEWENRARHHPGHRGVVVGEAGAHEQAQHLDADHFLSSLSDKAQQWRWQQQRRQTQQTDERHDEDDGGGGGGGGDDDDDDDDENSNKNNHTTTFGQQQQQQQ
jgi:hypothetical protein